MTEPLLKITGVTKRFGGFTALDGVDLAVAPGERFGLIGPNGSGKTTLINCISGSLRNESGTIMFSGEEISSLPAYQRTRRGIARSFQIPRPFTSMTVLENLLVPLQFVRHLHALHRADTRAEAMEILNSIGLADKADALSNRLSQVELRKMELELIISGIDAGYGAVRALSGVSLRVANGEIVFEGNVAELEQNDPVKNYYLGSTA